MSNVTLDPMDNAVMEAERNNVVYGQLEIRAEFVMFANKRKVQWVEGQDDPRDRRTEVTMLVGPIEQTGFTNFFTRNAICSNNNEWGTIVWPSLRDDCKVENLRDAHLKWVKAEIVKTGRSYTNNRGQMVDNTTFKFLAIYNTEAECVKAYHDDGNTPRMATPQGKLNGGHSADTTFASSESNDAERQAALAFLPPLVKAANGNRDMLATTLATLAPINKYFTIDSPEVAALL